jgi:hypothetical protein
MYNLKPLAGILCLAATLLIAPIKLRAQSDATEANLYNKVSIASPTAASLAKFVDIPVSLNTGIPQIDIPLCSIKDGQLSVPVSMSYHASGLKTLEPASWVGAGWALNAGGVITRSVRGTPDEKGTVNNFQKSGFYSDYGYRTHLLTVGYPVDPYGNQGRPDSGYMARYERFADGEYDSEPDLFFFNFGGYSGKFYFNDDRTPMLLPEQDVKIEMNYTYGSSESIQGFTLTTPDGTKYYFGATPSTTDTDPVEFTKVFTDQNGTGWDKVLSSWYLNKIVSADGNNTISLAYRPVVYSYYSMSLAPGNQGSSGYKSIRNYIHGVELANITSSNGQVNFVQAAQPRQDLSGSNTTGVEQTNGQFSTVNAAYPLGRIDILQKNGQTLLKSYKFNYSYFNDATGPVATTLNVSTTDKMRLKLLSIQEQTASGTLTPPYKFDYFSEPVPRRLTFGQDHWGFINGVTTNGNNLIGTYYNQYTLNAPVAVTGADRDVHWPAVRGGTLQKITFPTGGYNTYDFEPNQVYTTVMDGSNPERTWYASKTAGYDGCDCTKRDTLKNLELDYHQYVFQLSNAHYGGSASVNIYNSNWVLVDHMDANNDGVTELQRNYTPGLYNFVVIKYSAYGGNGAYLNIYQLAGAVTNTNQLAGGLRIKTITQSSGNGNPDMVTSYDYTDGPNNLSSGVLFGKPTIAQVVRNDIYKDYFAVSMTPPYTTGITDAGCPVPPSSGLTFLISGASVRPMNSSQGSHIGYRKVTTRQMGNGYTVSYFNTDGENLVSRDDVVSRTIVTRPGTCTTTIPNYPSIPEPNSFKRGQLEYKAEYNEAGTLLQDVTYSSNYQDNPLTTPAFVITRDAASGNSRMIFSWYEQKTARKTSETVVKKTYNTSGGFETTEQSFYDSPNHHQLSKRIATNSSGDNLETRYSYVPDYTVATVDGLDNGLANYGTQLSAVNYTFNATVANCFGAPLCRRIAWLDYDVALSHKRMDFINYRIANFTGANNTYQTRLQQALTNAGAVLKPLVDLRIQNNLALVETVNLKNAKVINATYNTYDYKPSSQNKIYLSKVSKTDFLVPPASFIYTKTGTDNISVVKDAAYNEKAAFEYLTGNISQVKLTDNVPTAYVWGYSNQYPVASAKNAKASNIFFESFEEGAGNGTLNDSKSGHYSHINAYSKILAGLDNGAYKLTYYKKVSGLWQWITTDVPVTAGTYTISLNAQIDDIRFAPADALMTTYTYDPEIGMTSSMDQNGVLIYYEYDGLQRLKTIKDKDKNILKSYCYNYAGQQGACDIPGVSYYYSTIQSQSFTRTDCSAGSTAGSVIYTVPDSTYISTLSTADANAQALADIAANGQSYANANGTCTLPTPFALIRQTSATSGNPQNYATYEIALFADASFTIPYVATQTITVNYKIRTSTVVNNGTPTVINTNTSAPVLAGNNTRYLGSFESGCGVAPEALVSQTTASTAQSTNEGGASINNVLPPGGGTTCITKTLLLLPGTGYNNYLPQ